MADREAQALLWVEAVVGTRLSGGAGGGAVDMHGVLRSGEVLCDLANAIKPGLVPRVTRTPREGGGGGMSAMRLAAKQRDNITRCARARV
eukprot:3699157-Prymnesium_polylepis.1